MLPVERGFPSFAREVLGGLYTAVLTDPDVLLLATAAICLGGTTRRPRGLGVGLAMYVTFRRLDSYVDAGIQLGRLSHITKQNPTPTSNG